MSRIFTHQEVADFLKRQLPSLLENVDREIEDIQHRLKGVTGADRRQISHRANLTLRIDTLRFRQSLTREIFESVIESFEGGGEIHPDWEGYDDRRVLVAVLDVIRDGVGEAVFQATRAQPAPMATEAMKVLHDFLNLLIPCLLPRSE